MTARADAAAATAERIIEAARAHFIDHPYDEVTLGDIASDAGVTTQTVLRRFGSKEGLVRAIVDAVFPQVVTQRDQAPAGDVDAAIANLIEHYEIEGDEAMMLLRQEHRVSVLAEAAAAGRAYHAKWVGRVFEPWLARASRPEVLRAQLVAACDAYTWFLLRRQAGLSRDDTELAIKALVKGVLR